MEGKGELKLLSHCPYCGDSKKKNKVSLGEESLLNFFHFPSCVMKKNSLPFWALLYVLKTERRKTGKGGSRVAVRTRHILCIGCRKRR